MRQVFIFALGLFFSKIDGLVALTMALGVMSAEDILIPSSQWDDPEFKLAV